MSALTATLNRWLLAWQRMRLEAEITQADRTIDGIRTMRLYDEEQQRALEDYRAACARKLQALAQQQINQRRAANVRALGKQRHGE